MAASGPAMFRVVATISAIFGIGLVAVSGTLLNQAIGYREYYFYGYAGAGYGRGGSGFGNQGYYAQGQGQYGYGSGGYGGGGLGYQEESLGYDPYRYHRVIAVAAVALGAGILQFLIALLLCCVNSKNSKPLAVGYIAGYVLILLALLVCFGLAFQYRVIYPYYFYNSYSAAYSYYQQYNPSGQAFCAILGIDLIYIFVSLILVGVFAKRESAYGDGDEWHIRSTATPSTAPVNEYGRDGVRIA